MRDHHNSDSVPGRLAIIDIGAVVRMMASISVTAAGM